jgi:hypothetical protein
MILVGLGHLVAGGGVGADRDLISAPVRFLTIAMSAMGQMFHPVKRSATRSGRIPSVRLPLHELEREGQQDDAQRDNQNPPRHVVPLEEHLP